MRYLSVGVIINSEAEKWLHVAIRRLLSLIFSGVGMVYSLIFSGVDMVYSLIFSGVDMVYSLIFSGWGLLDAKIYDIIQRKGLKMRYLKQKFDSWQIDLPFYLSD